MVLAVQNGRFVSKKKKKAQRVRNKDSTKNRTNPKPGFSCGICARTGVCEVQRDQGIPGVGQIT